MKQKYILIISIILLPLSLLQVVYGDNLLDKSKLQSYELSNKVYNLLVLDNNLIYYDMLGHCLIAYSKSKNQLIKKINLERSINKISIEKDDKQNIYVAYQNNSLRDRNIYILVFDKNLNLQSKKQIKKENDYVISKFKGLKIASNNEFCLLFAVKKDFKDQILIVFYDKNFARKNELLIEGELVSDKVIDFDNSGNIIYYNKLRQVTDFVFVYNRSGMMINNIRLKDSQTQIFIDKNNNLNMLHPDYEFVKGVKTYKAVFRKYTLNGEPIYGFDLYGKTYKQTPYFYVDNDIIYIYFQGDKKVVAVNKQDNGQSDELIDENENNPNPDTINPLIGPMGF